MSNVAGTTRQITCQWFSGVPNPRFKIDRYGDWQESYPAQDRLVEDNTFQRIEIDTQTKQVSVTPVSSCGVAADEWFFRGTSNEWGATALLRVDGTSRYALDVEFAREDPRPRFKIDRFGDWQQSYPDADYEVSDCSRYRIVFDAQALSVAAQRLGAVSSGDCAAEPPPPPPPGPQGADFRAETIYFVLTARFYDGDPGNNYYNRDRLELGDPQWRGDFAGLILKLDYIKELGFTAIWITPPVENRSGLDYHGYHGYDFTRVDPRLESPGATYQDFINEAHARGLKVIQDVVVNHSSQYGLRGQVWIDHLPIKYYRPQGGQTIINGPYVGNLGDYKSPYREDNDNPVAPDWFKARQTSDPEGIVPLVDPLTGATVPSAGYNPNRFFGIDASTLDPNWYHLDGFMAGGDWENPTALQSKHLAGDTIDLATERLNVQQYINQSIIRYLDMGVDAIRLDTLKHVERSEALAMVNAWKAHKPDLFVFGEALVKGLGFGSELGNDNASALIRPWWYTRLTNDPGNPNGGGDSGLAVLDFPLFSTFRDNILNGNFSGVGQALSWDWAYGDPTTLVTFFQNHDVGPDNDFKYRFGGEAWKAALAYNLLWTIRGIPSLYYGEEIMFKAGAPQDIDGPNMTVSETGRAYFGPHLTGGGLAATRSHPLFGHIQRLNAIRRAVPALQRGTMSQVNEFGGGISFVRDAGDSYAVVGLAVSDQDFSVAGVRNGTYRDAVTGRVQNVSGGVLNFSVRGRSAGIWVFNGSGKIGVDGDFLR
ncbi:MAG: alpha-amylase family glycosyl hydrolase [Myxococcota bacterium]